MNGGPPGAKRVGLGVGSPGLGLGGGVAPRVAGLGSQGQSRKNVFVAPIDAGDLDGDLPSSQQEGDFGYDAAQQEEDWKKYGANMLEELNMDLGGGNSQFGILGVPRSLQVGSGAAGPLSRASNQYSISQATSRVGLTNLSTQQAPVASPAPMMPPKPIIPPKTSLITSNQSQFSANQRIEPPRPPVAAPVPEAIQSQQRPDGNPIPTQGDFSPPATMPHFANRNRAVNSTQDLASILQKRPPAAPRSEPLSRLFSDPAAAPKQSQQRQPQQQQDNLEDQFLAPPAAKRAKPNPPPVPQQRVDQDDDLDLARDAAAANFSLIRRKNRGEIPTTLINSGAGSASTSASTSSHQGMSDGRRILPGPVGALPARTTFQKEELDRSIDGIFQNLLNNGNGAPAGAPNNSNNNNNDLGANSKVTSAAAAKAVVQNGAISRQIENDHDFRSRAWVRMMELYKLPPFGPAPKLKYSIAWLQSDGYMSKTKKLIVLVKLIQQIDEEASAILRDPTGEISATVHSRVLEKYQFLSEGCVLVLEDVASLSEASKSHHLIITDLNVKDVIAPYVTPENRLPKRFDHLSIYEEVAHPKQEELDEADQISTRNRLFESRDANDEDDHDIGGGGGGDLDVNVANEAAAAANAVVGTPELPGNLDFLTLDKKPLAITNNALLVDNVANSSTSSELVDGALNRSVARGRGRGRGGGGGGGGGGAGYYRGRGRGGGRGAPPPHPPAPANEDRAQGQGGLMARSVPGPAPWEMDSPAPPKLPAGPPPPPPPWQQQPKRPAPAPAPPAAPAPAPAPAQPQSPIIQRNNSNTNNSSNFSPQAAQAPRPAPMRSPVPNSATARVLQSTMSPPPTSPPPPGSMVSALSHATGNLGGVANFTRRNTAPVFNNQNPFQRPPT